MQPAEQIARALAFKRERVVRAAELAEPVADVPGALALSSPSLSLVWELNLLLSPPAPQAHSVGKLFDTCERVQRAQGFTHRKLRISDPFAAEERALVAESRRLGWRIDRELVMVRRRKSDRVPRAGAVQELDRALVADAADRFLRREPQGHGPVARRQLVAQYERWEASVPSAHRLGVVKGGCAVAWCRVYDDGQTAEIDDVSVLHERRGRGLGRMLIEGALTLIPNDRMLFLCADPDDWPQMLYRRLGFDVVGQRLGASRPDPRT